MKDQSMFKGIKLYLNMQRIIMNVQSDISQILKIVTLKRRGRFICKKTRLIIHKTVQGMTGTKFSDLRFVKHACHFQKR